VTDTHRNRVESVIHRSQMVGGIPASLRSSEANAGHVLVRPGEQPWLPLADWGPDTVASVDADDHARLVLLNARRPGHGAFTRLIRRLRDFKLKPVVVCPTDRFAAALKRRGWRERVRPEETIWYPRRRV
jgi:hypothetical protein